MRYVIIIAVIAMAMVGWGVTQSNAAQIAQVCPQFISDAINAVGNNCGGLGRNSACYGYQSVQATFEQLPSPDYFTRPADIADLFNLRSVSTSPLRTTLDQWGITLLSVQANLPDTLPGQNVIFMLAGDVGVENAVDPQTASDPNAQEKPVQAFYFRTGIGQTDCSQAPDTLIVQGPRGVQVDLTANGANIQIGSTIAFRTLAVDPAFAARIKAKYGFTQDIYRIMELFVLDGHVVLNPGTDHEQYIPEGYRGFRCLADPQNLGLDGETNDTPVFDACPWVDIQPATEQEIQEFAGYEGVVLNYPITLPDAVTTVASAPTNTPVPPTAVPPTAVPPTAAPPTVTQESTPEATPTDVTPNQPPTFTLDTPEGSVPRDSFLLTGSYDDPDDASLTLTVDWGDGSSEVFSLPGAGGGGTIGGGAASEAAGSPVRFVAGTFGFYHAYDLNGNYTVTGTVEDSASNQVTKTINILADPVFPLFINKISGSKQTAGHGQLFESPLIAQVMDADDTPVRGYPVTVDVSNGTMECTGCDVTNESGIVSVVIRAGSVIGQVPVTMTVNYPGGSSSTQYFIYAVNNPPTVVINNSQGSITNGTTFTLDFDLLDTDGDPMDVTIDTDDGTPTTLTGLSSGNHTFNHEFAAAGTMFIKVLVSDGYDGNEADYTLVVNPLYPLTVTHSANAGWTGIGYTGLPYAGSLHVNVQDASGDPVYGAELWEMFKAQLTGITPPGTPPITLGGLGGGSSDLSVRADCTVRSTLEIGSPDPSGTVFSTTSGAGRFYTITRVTVSQTPAFNNMISAGDDQTVGVGATFTTPLTVQVLDHTGSPVVGGTVNFLIHTVAGAHFVATGAITGSASTDSGGFATAPAMQAGGAEDFTVDASYDDGNCIYITTFNLQAINLPGVVGPDATDGESDLTPTDVSPEPPTDGAPTEIMPTEIAPTPIPPTATATPASNLPPDLVMTLTAIPSGR